MCRSGARAAIARQPLDAAGVDVALIARGGAPDWPAAIDPATAPPGRTPGHGDDAGCGPRRGRRSRPRRGGPLGAYRERFLLPTATDGTHKVYLAGHSLGAQPAAARAEVEIELEAWARRGVDGWFADTRSWIDADGAIREADGEARGRGRVRWRRSTP